MDASCYDCSVRASALTLHLICGMTNPPCIRYCDLDAFCYDCSACASALDAVDGVCPVKCGAQATFEIGDSLPDEPEPDAIGPIKDVVFANTAPFEQFVLWIFFC